MKRIKTSKYITAAMKRSKKIKKGNLRQVSAIDSTGHNATGFKR